jgi:hypothetical protein
MARDKTRVSVEAAARLMSATRAVMPAIADVASTVDPCSSATCRPMTSVASLVCPARVFTSAATTANPRPASPARAASIAALNGVSPLSNLFFLTIGENDL